MRYFEVCLSLGKRQTYLYKSKKIIANKYRKSKKIF